MAFDTPRYRCNAAEHPKLFQISSCFLRFLQIECESLSFITRCYPMLPATPWAESVTSDPLPPGTPFPTAFWPASPARGKPAIFYSASLRRCSAGCTLIRCRRALLSRRLFGQPALARGKPAIFFSASLRRRFRRLQCSLRTSARSGSSVFMRPHPSCQSPGGEKTAPAFLAAAGLPGPGAGQASLMSRRGVPASCPPHFLSCDARHNRRFSGGRMARSCRCATAGMLMLDQSAAPAPAPRCP